MDRKERYYLKDSGQIYGFGVGFDWYCEWLFFWSGS